MEANRGLSVAHALILGISIIKVHMLGRKSFKCFIIITLMSLNLENLYYTDQFWLFKSLKNISNMTSLSTVCLFFSHLNIYIYYHLFCQSWSRTPRSPIISLHLLSKHIGMMSL